MPSRAPEPAGIGNCRVCPYLVSGTADICYRCARQTIEALARKRCMVCDLEFGPSERCSNPVCSWPLEKRFFDWNFAIAMRSGVLKTAISNFKYSSRRGWRQIFARVLVGFLDDESATFDDFDLIVASPTYLDPAGSRPYDHTREIVLAADEEAEGRWPFDVSDEAAIVKTEATERFVGKTWHERRAIAEGRSVDRCIYPIAPEPKVARSSSLMTFSPRA